jgi:hypothetical protein
MIHEQSIQFRTCTACQCRTGIDERTQFHGESSYGTGRAIGHLQEPSLSVCAQSRGHRPRGASSGVKASVYHQAVTGTDSKASAIRQLHREDFERNREPGSGGIPPWDPWAWLKAGDLRPEGSSWSTVLTGCQRKRSSRLISFLCPTGHGQRVVGPMAERNLRKA